MRHISNIAVLSFLDDVYRIVSFPFAWVNYIITTRILRRPYFGVWMGSAQGNPLRYKFMRQAIMKCAAERQSNDDGTFFRALEIGAYAGASSILFANALCDSGTKNPLVFSCDPWDSYLDVEQNRCVQYRIMNYNLSNGNVLRLFVRNVRAAGVSKLCRQFRGFSHEILPMVKDTQFDFVYIDGDHAPKAVLNDLEQSARLLAPGGYLSGDDLELQIEALDTEFVKIHADSDIALDPKSGRVFHPGVSIAVHEFFGRTISNFDGFWVVRWNGESFEDVTLDEIISIQAA